MQSCLNKSAAVLCLFLIVQIHSLVEFRNIKCVSRDKEFAEVGYCYLKSVNRTYKYASLKIILHKLPVYNFAANLAFLKRANGYKPFLYNVTVDGCSFLEKSTNQLHKYLASIFLPFINVNHTCPINHDIILEKLPSSYLNQRLTGALPMPHGEYALSSQWLAYGISRADVTIYITIS